MRILVLGGDGYIGYPLTQHLLTLGHEVYSIDNFTRRKRVNRIGSDSLTPIMSETERHNILTKDFQKYLGSSPMYLGQANPMMVRDALHWIQPDCIVHLAEMPSAPWSMIDPYHATTTIVENVSSTTHLVWAMKEECPDAHLLKLGTMGEYGTVDCDIPEGVVPNQPCAYIQGSKECIPQGNLTIMVDKECPMSGLLFPRQPGSFYHASKVHDTITIDFACRNWGLRSTDIMQGVVFGLMDTSPELITRFDYDEYFGTAINRFCAQAIIEYPLTVYGQGHQTRGWLPLKDSIQCLTLAIENPPKPGQYRTFNQFENIYEINKLAEMVCHASRELGLNVGIRHIPNPRKESEVHYYNPAHQGLFDLGYVPTTDIQSEIKLLLEQLLPYRDRVIEDVILPKTNWR